MNTTKLPPTGPNEPEHCRLVTFGRGGHSEYRRSARHGGYTSQGTLSGYDRPHNWGPHEGVNYTGAIVIDKRPAVEFMARPVSFVIGCPMPDADLVDGATERCPEPDPLLVSGLSGAFQFLAFKRMANDSYRGLDCVSVEEYARIWAAAGARIGTVEGGRIVWRDEGPEATEGWAAIEHYLQTGKLPELLSSRAAVWVESKRRGN